MKVSVLQTRKRGTRSDGRPFFQEDIERVWLKAQHSMKNHPLITAACQMFSKGFQNGTHALDDYGHIIVKEEYGTKEKRGWEIDHIHPVEHKQSYPKGSELIDDIENLRVRHWQSHARKGQNDARIYELEYEHIILNKSA